jgi:isopropylmalate/homocitrate/citramalate synthase
VGAGGSKIVLTARSGRSALAHRFHKLGYQYNRNDIDVLYVEFLKIADIKKEVADEDLQLLAKSLIPIPQKAGQALLQRRRPSGHSPCFSEILITFSIFKSAE